LPPWRAAPGVSHWQIIVGSNIANVCLVLRNPALEYSVRSLAAADRAALGAMLIATALWIGLTADHAACTPGTACFSS